MIPDFYERVSYHLLLEQQNRRNRDLAVREQGMEFAVLETPRERRLAVQRAEVNHAYRFARDHMLDLIDAGRVPMRERGRGMAMMEEAIEACKKELGPKRYSELSKLLVQVKHLKGAKPWFCWPTNAELFWYGVIVFAVLLVRISVV